MKKFFGAIISTAILLGSAASANAQSLREYHGLRMESKCTKTYYGAKWVGAFGGLSPIPFAGFLTAGMTESCDQWNMAKAEAEEREFARRNPSIVRRYNAQYGVPASSGSSGAWGPRQAFGSLNVAGN